MTEFVVRIPAGTPWDRGVFLTGDAESLGAWRPDAIRLAPHSDGTWRIALELPRGLRAKFLTTLGTWQTMEADATGREPPVRDVVIHGHDDIEFRVDSWGRGSVQYFESLRSQFLPHARPVWIYRPPGYDLHPERRYPVFYLHDGQNLFDPRTAFGGTAWGCDETAERLIRLGVVRPVLIVGVGNTPDRIKEYGPSRKRAGVADLSKAYGRFLVEELKPFIDSQYRTLTGPVDTAVGGSSMGGLISLYLARWYPDVFGRVAAMSPSLWYNREAYLRTVKARAGWINQSRIWIDFGDREGYSYAGMQAGLRRVRDLATAFRELGRVEDRDYHFAEIADGHHNEAAWGARFDRVLTFLFGTG